MMTSVNRFPKVSIDMRMAAFFLLCFCGVLQMAKGYDAHPFLNEWAAHIPGGDRVAREVAEEHGFEVVRASPSLPDHYLLRRADTPRRVRRAAHYHTRSLTDDHRVVFAEQQQHLARVKRDRFDEIVERTRAASEGIVDDPEFSHQWYMNQAVNSKRGDVPVTDLRVKDVWRMGISGKDIVITIIDDGLEGNHTDLANNYDPKASFDLNDNDTDPFPRYDPTNENKHGTRCAGVASMAINNNFCGAGIAFDSKVGGIRILDGKVNDLIESESLSFGNQHIDIYSASWGPMDNGKSMDGPRKLSRASLANGVAQGRGGKGSLFVWASGNGGHKGDCCSADGYASAIETISVSSSTQDGGIPVYAELCPSTLTTAYSSGSHREGRVVSADLHNKCTTSHTGTSASAPMVAGILALLLEIKYNNGAGYCVNLAFGFGLIDALGVVQLGHPSVWKGVGPQRICEVEPITSNGFPYAIQKGQDVFVHFRTDACAGMKNEINFLEHVKVLLSAEHERRGNMYVEIWSPMGTITPLLLERSQDTSTDAMSSWPLISTHNWGEKPRGIWTVRIADRNVFPFSKTYQGNVTSVQLVLYGTRHQPEHQRLYPRNCSVDRQLRQMKMKK